MLKLCLHRSGLENYLSKLCSSRKNPYALLGRSLEIPRGRGIFKVKILEAGYEAKLEFPGGGGVQNKKPSMGRAWIFSGTVQCSLATVIKKEFKTSEPLGQ